MKRSTPATPFRVVTKAGQSELTTSSESPEQALAVTPAQDLANMAASSSAAPTALARTGQRGRTGHTGQGSGSQQSPSQSFHQHVQHNAQHNTLNSIDPQQLENMITSLVGARVESSMLQLQHSFRDAMEQMEGQYREWLARANEERDAQIQRVQAEAELMLQQAIGKKLKMKE